MKQTKQKRGMVCLDPTFDNTTSWAVLENAYRVIEKNRDDHEYEWVTQQVNAVLWALADKRKYNPWDGYIDWLDNEQARFLLWAQK